MQRADRDFQSLAALVNLEVPTERQAAVLHSLRLLCADDSLLEAADLDAEEPSTVFDARWIDGGSAS
jgi:hypothetical protein